MQDEKRDQEAKVENIEEKEHELKEEIITLKDIVKGKDQAIRQLGDTIMTSGKENQKLAEMVNYFKNKLIVENCFQQSYGAKKMGGSNLQPLKNG